MAEDEDGVSNKKSAQNSNNGGSSQDNEQNRTDPPYFPRLLTPETDEAKCNNSENGDASLAEAKSSSSKSTGTTRKEDNPFSFRHFLKRDLSLPGNTSYESTGARPKVYASTVQHSPTLATREPPGAARDKEAPRASDNTSSSSSVEVSCSVGDNSESKHNLYTDNSDAQLYRPGLEPQGMPSLPDFVQDHILVEQAYLSSNGPISVDFENLPDFTFNTNYNAGSSSLGRRANSYGRGLYEPYLGASTSGSRPREPRVPLDLPGGAGVDAAPPSNRHLSLDLTESVPAQRWNTPPSNTFPLDLPPNAGAESMRLPDFLPEHPGRKSPEPEPDLQPLMEELNQTRSELSSERQLRRSLEEEVRGARAATQGARDELARLRRLLGAGPAPGDDAYRDWPEPDTFVGQLKSQIRWLKEELAASQAEVRSLRETHAAAARDLRGAADVADTSLRELLAGLAHLRSLSATLEPPPT